MTLRKFIQEHRQEIDEAIHKAISRNDPPGHIRAYEKLNDSDRGDWIANEVGLYSWARSEGVRV